MITFGGKDKYYSSSSYNDRTPKGVELQFAEIFKKLEIPIQQTVRNVKDRWNQRLRQMIVKETGLSLHDENNPVLIPVKIVNGIPIPLFELLEKHKSIPWHLLFKRHLLSDTANGIDFVLKNLLTTLNLESVKKLELIPKPDDMLLVKEFVDAINKELENYSVTKEISSIQEDIMGAYYYFIPEIHLYWLPIGIIALTFNMNIEDLTVIVLCHELVHAYTHRGKDIHNKTWDTNFFSATDIKVVEGLAQFYTHIITQKLRDKNPGIFETYEKLCKFQSPPYNVHLDWLKEHKADGEIIRAALIKTRRIKQKTYAEFLSTLVNADKNLTQHRADNEEPQERFF